MTGKGREIVASLTDALEVEQAGIPLASRFTVRTVTALEGDAPESVMTMDNHGLGAEDLLSLMMPAVPILALVRDLIFSTKISTTARAAGMEVKIIRDPLKLGGEAGRLLLVDLNLAGAIEAAAGWRLAGNVPVIGFVSHVDAETAARARSAGIDRVLARSRFVEILPELLTGQTVL